MDSISITTLLSGAGMVTAIGGSILTVQRIQRNLKKEKAAEVAAILHAAKEADHDLKIEIQAKINSIKSDLDNLESNVNKDLDHLRETYNGEIRNLGNKIEDLRSELRNQHGQLVALLTKMIDSR